MKISPTCSNLLKTVFLLIRNTCIRAFFVNIISLMCRSCVNVRLWCTFKVHWTQTLYHLNKPTKIVLICLYLYIVYQYIYINMISCMYNVQKHLIGHAPILYHYICTKMHLIISICFRTVKRHELRAMNGWTCDYTYIYINIRHWIVDLLYWVTTKIHERLMHSPKAYHLCLL